MLINHLLTYPSLVNSHICIYNIILYINILYYMTYIYKYIYIYIYKVIQFLYIQVMTSCGTSPPKHQLLRWRPSGAWLSPLRRPRPGVSEGSPAADLLNLWTWCFLGGFWPWKSGSSMGLSDVWKWLWIRWVSTELSMSGEICSWDSVG